MKQRQTPVIFESFRWKGNSFAGNDFRKLLLLTRISRILYAVVINQLILEHVPSSIAIENKLVPLIVHLYIKMMNRDKNKIETRDKLTLILAVAAGDFIIPVARRISASNNVNTEFRTNPLAGRRCRTSSPSLSSDPRRCCWCSPRSTAVLSPPSPWSSLPSSASRLLLLPLLMFIFSRKPTSRTSRTVFSSSLVDGHVTGASKPPGGNFVVAAASRIGWQDLRLQI